MRSPDHSSWNNISRPLVSAWSNHSGFFILFLFEPQIISLCYSWICLRLHFLCKTKWSQRQWGRKATVIEINSRYSLTFYCFSREGCWAQLGQDTHPDFITTTFDNQQLKLKTMTVLWFLPYLNILSKCTCNLWCNTASSEGDVPAAGHEGRRCWRLTFLSCHLSDAKVC